MIEPVATDSFIQSDKKTYEEVGTVIAGNPELVGKEVLFDSWLAKKITIKGKEMWFVKQEDLIAYGDLQE